MTSRVHNGRLAAAAARRAMSLAERRQRLETRAGFRDGGGFLRCKVAFASDATQAVLRHHATCGAPVLTKRAREHLAEVHGINGGALADYFDEMKESE